MTICKRLLILFVAVLSFCQLAAARSDTTWLPMGKIPSIATITYHFLNPQWQTEDVFPNVAKPLQMEVRIETFGTNLIDLNEIRMAGVDAQNPSHEDPVYVELDSPTPAERKQVQGIPVTVRVYRCNIIITDKAKPQPYRLRLKFSVRTNWIEFEIPVGTHNSSHLQINRDKDKTLTIVPQQQTPISLHLHNSYTTYTVTVNNIAVTGDPPNLIGKVITDPPTPFDIPPQTSVPVEVKVIGARLTYTQMIQGEQSPTLSLRVDYNDHIVAQQKSEPPLSVSLKADYNAAEAYLWALFGGGFGILLRLAVGGKQDTGSAAKPQSLRGYAREILLSLILVGVVLFLTQVLKMEIFAVERRFPFSSPLMGGVTGLFVGMVSPQSIVDKLRSMLNIGGGNAAPRNNVAAGGT